MPKTAKYQRIKLEEKFIPLDWKKRRFGEVGINGGLFLVFVEGRTNKVVQAKIRKIKRLCKELRKEYKDL